MVRRGLCALHTGTKALQTFEKSKRIHEFCVLALTRTLKSILHAVLRMSTDVCAIKTATDFLADAKFKQRLISGATFQESLPPFFSYKN